MPKVTSQNQIKNQDVRLSKTLSWFLRHGALKEKLTISSEGFVAVDQLLKHPKLSRCLVSDIERIVATNDKSRFTLRTSPTGVLEIRANQGHSIESAPDLELEPITDERRFENVIHGTYFKFWDSIKRKGLFRGRRNHIHFSPGLPGVGGVISGARSDAEIFIYLDLDRALAAGLRFYVSTNNVILCEGNADGFISSKYFKKVCRRDGSMLVH